MLRHAEQTSGPRIEAGTTGVIPTLHYSRVLGLRPGPVTEFQLPADTLALSG